MATDLAGNSNTASAPVTVTIDTIVPTVTITPADGTTTGDDPVTFTATFSEDVQNFVLSDITVAGTANGGSPTASNIGGTGSVYTFNVARGSSDGTIIVSIAADVAADLAGNPNTASAPVTVTINTTGDDIEDNIPLGGPDGQPTYEPSSNLITLNVIHDTLPDTIIATDGQLLNFNGAPTFADDSANGVKSVTISNSTTVVTSAVSNSQTVTVTYPANVVVTGSFGDWTGRIAVPSLSTDVTSPPTSNGEIGLAFSVGDDNTRLTFDQAVRLLLPGQASHDGAFFSGENADGNPVSRPLVVCPFVPVNQATANTNLGAGTALESCFVRDGSDMIIWTTHFSSFGSFSVSDDQPDVTPSASSGGNRGGGGGGGGGGGSSGQSADSRVCGLQLCSEINAGTGSSSGSSISANNTQTGAGQDLMDPEPQVPGPNEDEEKKEEGLIKMDPEPAMEAEMDPEPAMEAEMDPEPAMEAEMDPEPSMETGTPMMDPEPAMEAEMDPEPQVPGLNEKTDPEPTAETGTSTMMDSEPPQTGTDKNNDQESTCGPGTQLVDGKCVPADSQSSSEDEKGFFAAIQDFFSSLFGFA